MKLDFETLMVIRVAMRVAGALRSHCVFGLLVLVALAAPVATWAQATSSAALPKIPSSLEPGRERLDDGLSSPLSRPGPAPASVVGVKAPAGAETVEFVFDALYIEGAKALARERLLALWSPQRGDRVSLADAYKLTQAITRAYGQAGYVLSFALAPVVKDGSITIRVVEGFIDKVEYAGLEQGSKYSGVIQALANNLLNTGPLKVADLERYLLLINDLPGISAQSTIAPSPVTPGGSILMIEVSRQKHSASALYNNNMSKSLGTHVVGALVSTSGLAQGGDELQVNAWHSVTNRAFNSVRITYTTAVGSEGLKVGASWDTSSTRPTDSTLQALDYQGQSQGVRLYAAYPLTRARQRNLVLQGGLGVSNLDGYKSVNNARQSLLRDRLRSMDLGLSYDFVSEDQSLTALKVGLEKGLPILNASGDSRANGTTDYTLVTASAQHTKPLGDVGGGRASLFAIAQGQVALDGALFSSSECGFGGRRFGRSFDAGVFSADDCLLASLELRWDRLLTGPDGQNMAYQVYGFWDGGVTQQKGVLQAGELRRVSATSAGIGVRFELSRAVSAAIEVSQAVKAPTGTALDRSDKVRAAATWRF